MSPTVRNIIKPLASLKITVTILALAFFLIFAGTLAQQYQGNWETVNTYFRSFGVFIPLELFAPVDFLDIPGYLPFPGGFTLGSLLLVNLLSGYATRFVFTWKRCGILLLHSGILLLITGEAVTHYYGQEATMAIDEGSFATYTEDSRKVELAIIDPANPDSDKVVVIPQAILIAHAYGQTIKHPELPFDVRVDHWMKNSHIVGLGMAKPQQRENNPATAGIGTIAVASPIAPSTGLENSIDFPAAYITLQQGDKSPGCYLVSPHLVGRQAVEIAGKRWDIVLRFKRTYRPYTMYLIDFTHDKFVGTEKARNFSSRVRIVDPQNKVDREALIYMNHPLYYRGETFYQSSFKPDGSGTVLQVVRNPGWRLPYYACGLVSLGMLIHFVAMLIRFVGRQMG